jgi:glycosyltransferase involved in cell wall biosynthesis
MGNNGFPDQAARKLIIATILRDEGTTGVHTHFQQLRRYLAGQGCPPEIITPFSWARPLTVPAFGLRLILERCSGAASVAWYRRGHEVFLRQALRRDLAQAGDCVIYAQCPLSARAALRARTGPHQRVILAVHFRISQADEWADKKLIKVNGAVFRGIRQLERDVIPRVDGLMYVSRWARDALTEWLPEAAAVPSVVIENFVTPPPAAAAGSDGEPLADLVTIGHLEPVKNHRYLLEILAAARQAGRPLTLDIYGAGPLHRDLQRQAADLGLDGQVRLRGFRPDVRDFLSRYRAYVHVSYSESSSLAIIEAMAAGLPIVAGNIGPLGELYDDGVEGRFWPLDDPDQAAATLTGLLDSEPARMAAAAAARQRFRRDFDAGVLGPRLTSFLLGAPAGESAPATAQAPR